MKCPLCSDGSMEPTSVRRFGPVASALWVLVSTLVIAGAALALISHSSSSDQKAAAIVVAVTFTLVASLVLSGVPVWACYACGHWTNRTSPPVPLRASKPETSSTSQVRRW